MNFGYKFRNPSDRFLVSFFDLKTSKNHIYTTDRIDSFLNDFVIQKFGMYEVAYIYYRYLKDGNPFIGQVCKYDGKHTPQNDIPSLDDLERFGYVHDGFSLMSSTLSDVNDEAIDAYVGLELYNDAFCSYQRFDSFDFKQYKDNSKIQS